MVELSAIAGLVVMGGRASRLGGVDKTLIEIGGRTVLSRLIERFAPQVGALALSANGDPERFAAFGLPVLADGPSAPQGPLGGVLAGLAWAAEQSGVTHLATTPGDAPSPPMDLVARLAAAAADGAAAAHSPRGVEPLHALWPISALERLVREGLRSPKRALEALGAAAVRFDGEVDFLDLDTPQDIDKAKRLLQA